MMFIVHTVSLLCLVKRSLTVINLWLTLTMDSRKADIMVEFLEFTFQSFWHWLGVMLLVLAFGSSIGMVFRR